MRYFKIGDSVLSKTYGMGVIEKIKENSLLLIGVEFESGRYEFQDGSMCGKIKK